MTYPVCPHCGQGMIRTHERDDNGKWRVVWLCACQPDPEIVAQMEKKIATLQGAGTKTTIVRRQQWVRS
jgi:hypothetical protein